ncbi:MAG TPA: Flp family type IVb pilin [Reyranella sp.]|jgi:Flp pilus assembly pilin Flp|nr:Flp family type IVb pilin [Reyranella sp.]
MLSVLRHLLRSERGVTMIEYSLIICLIACAAIGAFSAVGQSVLGRLGPASNALQ